MTLTNVPIKAYDVRIQEVMASLLVHDARWAPTLSSKFAGFGNQWIFGRNHTITTSPGTSTGTIVMTPDDPPVVGYMYPAAPWLIISNAAGKLEVVLTSGSATVGTSAPYSVTYTIATRNVASTNNAAVDWQVGDKVVLSTDDTECAMNLIFAAAVASKSEALSSSLQTHVLLVLERLCKGSTNSHYQSSKRQFNRYLQSNYSSPRTLEHEATDYWGLMALLCAYENSISLKLTDTLINKIKATIQDHIAFEPTRHRTPSSIEQATAWYIAPCIWAYQLGLVGADVLGTIKLIFEAFYDNAYTHLYRPGHEYRYAARQISNGTGASSKLYATANRGDATIKVSDAGTTEAANIQSTGTMLILDPANPEIVTITDRDTSGTGYDLLALSTGLAYDHGPDTMVLQFGSVNESSHDNKYGLIYYHNLMLQWTPFYDVIKAAIPEVFTETRMKKIKHLLVHSFCNWMHSCAQFPNSTYRNGQTVSSTTDWLVGLSLHSDLCMYPEMQPIARLFLENNMNWMTENDTAWIGNLDTSTGLGGSHTPYSNHPADGLMPTSLEMLQGGDGNEENPWHHGIELTRNKAMALRYPQLWDAARYPAKEHNCVIGRFSKGQQRVTITGRRYATQHILAKLDNDTPDKVYGANPAGLFKRSGKNMMSRIANESSISGVWAMMLSGRLVRTSDNQTEYLTPANTAPSSYEIINANGILLSSALMDDHDLTFRKIFHSYYRVKTVVGLTDYNVSQTYDYFADFYERSIKFNVKQGSNAYTDASLRIAFPIAGEARAYSNHAATAAYELINVSSTVPAGGGSNVDGNAQETTEFTFIDCQYVLNGVQDGGYIIVQSKGATPGAAWYGVNNGGTTHAMAPHCRNAVIYQALRTGTSAKALPDGTEWGFLVVPYEKNTSPASAYLFATKWLTKKWSVTGFSVWAPNGESWRGSWQQSTMDKNLFDWSFLPATVAIECEHDTENRVRLYASAGQVVTIRKHGLNPNSMYNVVVRNLSTGAIVDSGSMKPDNSGIISFNRLLPATTQYEITIT